MILQVSMFDFDLIGGDDFIGDVAIKLADLPDGTLGRISYIFSVIFYIQLNFIWHLFIYWFYLFLYLLFFFYCFTHIVQESYKLNRGDGCGELENIALLLGARSKKDDDARVFIQKRSLAETPLVLNLIKLPIQILDPRNNPLIKLIVSKASC